jgi:DTW domain-containing protein YfiP
MLTFSQSSRTRTLALYFSIHLKNMARNICQKCQRPERACICLFTCDIENNIKVVVLQHPSEVVQSKGTVTLLNNSLDHCQIIVGENFSENVEFNELLSHFKNRIQLLYPSEHAQVVSGVKHRITSGQQHCLVVLDGTWKKAYRMYMLSENLHSIPHLSLPEGLKSLYKIRKTKKDHALSTLEACCHALSLMEGSVDKYQVLLNNFIKFNDFQLSFNSAHDPVKNFILDQKNLVKNIIKE